MEIRRITDEFSISDQLTAKDVAQAHTLGFETILCMRPDGEDQAQPLFESIAKAADSTGIQSAYLPIAGTGPTQQDVDELKALLPDLPKPVLAYCRSGARVVNTYNRAFPQGA